MAAVSLSRRTVLQTAAATALTAPFVRGAHAAGKLRVGFWDHWVPGANDVMTKICNEWAEKEKVDIQVDFITTNLGLFLNPSDAVTQLIDNPSQWNIAQKVAYVAAGSPASHP